MSNWKSKMKPEQHEPITNVNFLFDRLVAKMITSHNPELTKDRNVTRLWEDGELTYEKGADLFGQRNLHTIRAALLPAYLAKIILPQLPFQESKHAYIICTDKDAESIRVEMARVLSLLATPSL